MPNYLLLTPCGFYLRLRVPADLQVTLGKRKIKKPFNILMIKKLLPV